MIDNDLPAFDMLIFGASGDLSMRKLFPALYEQHCAGQLNPDGRIIGVSRSPYGRESFAQHIKEAMINFGINLEADKWDSFAERIHYVPVDAEKPESYLGLVDVLQGRENHVRVVYLATISALYASICKNLSNHDLISDNTRLVLEKPIGRDFDTAAQINKDVAKFVNEDQIYRIDHYLGKETVQNLLVLRFANSIIESQWNHHWIDNIQITISESLGLEGRAGYYDKVGALRDMVQNHLLQLLCITAMEPPASMDADAVRDEKVKVLRSLRPIQGLDIEQNVVRGQYTAGAVNGKPVQAYRDEPGVNLERGTETFVAMKVEIDNWRWAGVPFYLRTGKRLPCRACEIVVQFKAVPHSIFSRSNKNLANKLVFRLQPDEGVQLHLSEKQIGSGMRLGAAKLSLSPEANAQERVPDAYERLIGDVILGNQTLFVREDELMSAWNWVNPILDYWDKNDVPPETYSAGTWGPSAATLLLARDHRLWEDSEF